MTSADATAAAFETLVAEPRRRPMRRVAVALAVALALLSAFLTFIVLTGLTPIVPTREVVVTFLLINSATIVLLLFIIGSEVWSMIQARRSGRAAARLHEHDGVMELGRRIYSPACSSSRSRLTP